MGFLKKLGKKLKGAVRDIATVVGFAFGGPAGAAIGQGIGSLAEGRGLKKSLGSAGKVFAGANVLTGAGITGGGAPGSRISFTSPAGGATVTSGGIPGVFQSIGADVTNLLTGQMGGSSLTSPAFKGLSTLEKGVLAGGL